MARVRFKDLPMSKPFRFASELDFPNSGMVTGPWVRVSTRKYSHATRPGFLSDLTVGSINVEVITVEAHDDREGKSNA